MHRGKQLAIAFAALLFAAALTSSRLIHAGAAMGVSPLPVPAPSAGPRGPGATPTMAAPDDAAMNQILAHDWAALLYRGARPKLRSEQAPGPYVALTFDDGPKPWGTPLVLQELEEYHARATFFLVGKQCVLYPALVARIVADGNELGNHTYDHYRLPYLSAHQVAEELEHNRAVLRQITGQTVYLFRPPGGRTNNEIQTIIDSLGYTTVFWRIDSGELAADSTPTTVYHHVLDHVRSGDIVLLHNGDPNIVAALPNILAVLRQRGYHFVTVSELMQMNGAQPTSDPSSEKALTE